jgi:hypothetical protein
MISSCGSATPPSQSSVLTPDKTQVAFFDRPVALAAARASSTPTPLIVMLASDPWLGVVGSDSPAFALYDDGTAIFATKAGYASTKLDSIQLKTFFDAFDNRELRNFAGGYEAAEATDQPDNHLLVYGRDASFYITVYGYLESPSVRSKLPAPVLSSFDRLRKFASSTAQAWLPSSVEVMVWPYEYAPDPWIVWPERWPGLKAPTTRKRGDSYSIFVPPSELPALKTFLASRKEKGAVEIDGRKWAASIRLPFPHEALWMAPKTR